MKGDPTIFLAHALFWAVFIGARLRVRVRGKAGVPPPTTGAPLAEEKTAPYSKALLAFHVLAFSAMYHGIWQAVLAGQAPTWFFGRPLAGSLIIAMGAALAVWALAYFRSWRFRAKLDAGHQL